MWIQIFNSISAVFSVGALLFGCTVALCFLIRDLMFYVIGESSIYCFHGALCYISGLILSTQWYLLSLSPLITFNYETVLFVFSHGPKICCKTANWRHYVHIEERCFISCFLLVAGGITVSIIAFVFTIKFLCELAARVVSFLQNEDPGRRGDRSIYDYVRGNYLDPRSCKVSWDWKEPQEVGQTMSFRVQVRKVLQYLRLSHFSQILLLSR